jgi:imidazoleglycerol-phosphate dehydratase
MAAIDAPPRVASVHRVTNETDVNLRFAVDGRGHAQVATGVRFLDHMLDSFARHGLFDLDVKVVGDLDVDDHHTVEDVAITLGQAFRQALGDARGIRRFGDATTPLDESLARVALDISGRGICVADIPLDGPLVGDLKIQMVKHFFQSFAMKAEMSLHVDVIRGENDHHKVEACFKALAKALDWATQIDERVADEIPSTKGVL